MKNVHEILTAVLSTSSLKDRTDECDINPWDRTVGDAVVIRLIKICTAFYGTRLLVAVFVYGPWSSPHYDVLLF